jgi:hypothetical protein
MKCIRVSLAKTKEDGKFEVSAITNVEQDDSISTNDWEIILQTLKLMDRPIVVEEEETTSNFIYDFPSEFKNN